MNLDNISTRDHETQPVIETSKIQEPVPRTIESSTGGPVNYKRESTTNASKGYLNPYTNSVTYNVTKECNKYMRVEHIEIFLIDGYVAKYTNASIKITSKYIKIIDASQIEIKISLNIVRDISLTNIIPIK